MFVFREKVASMVISWQMERYKVLVCVELDKIPLLCKLKQLCNAYLQSRDERALYLHDCTQYILT